MTLPKYNPLVTPYAIVKNGKVHTIILKDCEICFPHGSLAVHWSVIRAKRNLCEDLIKYFGDYGFTLFMFLFQFRKKGL